MSRDYFLLKWVFSGSHCVLDKTPPEIKKSYRIQYGESMAQGYPEVPKFKMSSRRTGKKVPDAVYNTLNFLMVSQRLKALIEAAADGGIEFLPFQILDHKDKAVPGSFFIVNVLGTIDCVDRSRTEGEEDPMEPGMYQFIRKLHLDPARIPPEALIFRLSAKPQWIVVADDLRRRMEAQKVSGLQFRGMGESMPAVG